MRRRPGGWALGTALVLWALLPGTLRAQDDPAALPAPAPSPASASAAPPAPVPAPPAASPPAAETPPPRLPTPFALRPLTLPHGMLRLDATFHITSEERVAGADRQTYVSLLGVAAYGVTDDIELGLIALPLQVAPEGRYDDPGAYGLFRLLSIDRLELGLGIEASVPVRDESAFANALSLRVLWRPADIVRVDTGAYLVALYHDPIRTSLRFPLVVTVQLTDGFFVGAQTGLDAEYLSGADEAAGRRQNAYVPAGVFLGGTLPGDGGPTGDLRLGVFLPSVTDGLEVWQLGFGGSFYIY